METYYVKKLSTIDEAFCDALGGCSFRYKVNFNIVSRGIVQGINIDKTYGKIKIINDKMAEYFIKLSSISSGMTKDFVFELNILY